MAYKVAQLRKVVTQEDGHYMETVPVDKGKFFTQSKFNQSEKFQDFCLKGDFKAGQVYYLRVAIKRIPDGTYSNKDKQNRNLFANADDMTITLLLKETNDTLDENEDPPQIIDTFVIDSLTTTERDIGTNTQYYSYTTVFIPAKDMRVLGFRLTRTAYDALAVENGERTYRRWLTDPFQQPQPIIYSGKKGDLCRLKNIIPQNTDNGSSHWLKLGFQSRPGTLIVVNKCPIRVGRSGIYEINNGMIIDSFMITAPQGSKDENIDAFLLDYAYDENKEGQ